MPIWLLVVIICLATHRVTRLITRDALPLIATPRDAFAQRWGRYVGERGDSIGGKKTNTFMASIAYLWECDWCTSVWVAGGLTTVAYYTTQLGEQHWYISVLVGLTASTVTGLTAQREPS